MTTTETDLYQRICVRRPYYAYDRVDVPEPGTVTTPEVPVESPTGTDPISMPEAIRHGAILGLLAVASQQPDDTRHYYLAQTGTCAWLADYETRRNITEPLHARATGRLLGTRKGSGAATFYSGSIPIATVTANFAVMTTPVFERLFKHIARPDLTYDTPEVSPYIQPLDFEQLQISDRTATGRVTATPEQCSGHFEGYPALPVAVLIRSAIETATTLINDVEPEPWDLADGQMHPVTHLVPAGQAVELHAEIVHASPSHRLTKVTLNSNGVEIGYCTFGFIPA